MNTNVSDFMNALSQCCDRENYLSDVTYALCESNLEFRKFFLKFFFGGQLNAEQVSITREYRFGGFRPDFLIEARDPRDFFIVEVKINDRNHHFKDYEGVMRDLYSEASKTEDCKIIDLKEHIGYIANYQITHQEVKEAKGFKHIRTWQQFYEALKKGDTGLKMAPWLGDKGVEGYGQLCKAVCGFVDISEYIINIDDFKKIKKSIGWIKRLIYESKGVHPYYGEYQKACTSSWRIGRFFEVEKSGKSVWGWIGIYLVEEGAQCVVAFDDKAGWGDLVCREFKENCQNLEKTRGRTIEYSVDDQCLYFYMNDTEHGFIEEDTLRNFFDKVIQYIQGNKNAFADEEQHLVNCNEWLAMAKLPALIKKELFRGMPGRRYDVVFTEIGMNVYDYSWNISALCVEWFTMSFKRHDGRVCRQPLLGFVGVVWHHHTWFEDRKKKCLWIGDNDKVVNRLKGGPRFVLGIKGLRGGEKENARRHNWIEQKREGVWLYFLKESDLEEGRLRARLRKVLETILQIK